ncbi:LysR family transcriptional regulator [Phenylobacterium sp.]|uniref:LysR family transcriptional regulator n=1 Tax=Phenylobacterium sp. TaxID=1871053 RepID=UPI002C354BAE|nr:LysR family transcriptional regulator [Phenylobacterium sp.]HLZ74770.1 LysR family transcriptional regulator [Phenylobacterium sp.]
MIDTDDLRTFLEVAEAGGVTPAGRRLGLSKSIVSRQLSRLESALGAQLLSRTTRGAVLTEAGVTFREHAQRVVAELDAAQDALSADGEVRGRLRIAAPLSFGPTHLAPVLADLALQHPRLHVHAAYADRFVDLVGEGFDVAVRLGYLPDSSLVARRIAPVHGRLVASPDYLARAGAPTSPADLLEHEAIIAQRGEWRLRNGTDVVTVRPRARFSADNAEALMAAAVKGLGILLAPDFLAGPRLAAGDLVEVLPDYPAPEGGLYVVRPPGDHVPRKIRVLTDLLIERFGERSGVRL